MDKPIVQYRDVNQPVVVGRCAVVWPVDHPDVERVSNRKAVLTSPVLVVTEGASGPLFETHNTYYKPVDGSPVDQPAEYIDFGQMMERVSRERVSA